jgi:hypothetical protein
MVKLKLAAVSDVRATTTAVADVRGRWDLVTEYVRAWLRHQVANGPRGTQAALAMDLDISTAQMSNVTSPTPTRGIGPDLVMAVAHKLGYSLARLEQEALRSSGQVQEAQRIIQDLVVTYQDGSTASIEVKSSPRAISDPWATVEASPLFQLAPDRVKLAFRKRSVRLPPNPYRALLKAHEHLVSLQRDYEDNMLDDRPPSPHVEEHESGVRERSSEPKTATKAR